MKPTASFYATFGDRLVALEASAEERDTRGFTSMTIMRPSTGLMVANCTLERLHPRRIWQHGDREALRRIWYSVGQGSVLWLR